MGDPQVRLSAYSYTQPPGERHTELPARAAREQIACAGAPAHPRTECRTRSYPLGRTERHLRDVAAGLYGRVVEGLRCRSFKQHDPCDCQADGDEHDHVALH